MKGTERGSTRQPRKRFSLTRAGPTRDKLTRADRLRAAAFATVVRAASAAIGGMLRLRAVGRHHLPGWRRQGPGPLLFAMWHGDFYPIFRYARHSDVCVVVSRSPDGEILDRVLHAAGYRTVRGSSTHGATRAMIDLARTVRGGHDVAIAVDGPRGPARVAKPGIALLAKLTGCPIVPLGVGMTRCKTFASWDRLRLPLPLSRALIIAGEPIRVDAEAPDDVLQAACRRIDSSLHELSARAEADVRGDAFRRAERPTSAGIRAAPGTPSPPAPRPS